MKKVYVIQMDTKTVPSRIISFFTMYKYSHVVLSFDEDCNITYSFGRRNIYSIFGGGFVVESKNGDFFRKFKNTKCRIYEIVVSDSQYDCLRDTIKDMIEHKNIYGYDYLGIILRYLKFPIIFKNKYVCSYFVAELLENARICSFDKKTFNVKPKDFEKIDGLNLIYTGKYLMFR